MSDKWEELNRKEQLLMEQEADLVREEAKVERLEEDYIDHLFKTNHLFRETQQLFHGTEAQLYDEISQKIHEDSRKMEESLGAMQKKVRDRRKIVQRQLDEVYEEKQKLSRDGEEKMP